MIVALSSTTTTGALKACSAIGFNSAASFGSMNRRVHLVNILYVATDKAHQKGGLAKTLFGQISQRLKPRDRVPLMAIHAAIQAGM